MLDTQQIMKTALRLAHFNDIPADSEIHVKGRKLSKVLVSIDVGVGELLLAKALDCNGLIAHHPAGGKAQLEGYKVFMRHIDQMRNAGVPVDIAREAVKNKYRVLDIQHHPENYDQTPSAAKKLGLPLVTIHVLVTKLVDECWSKRRRVSMREQLSASLSLNSTSFLSTRMRRPE